MPTRTRFTITCFRGGSLIGIEGRGTFPQSPGFQALVAECFCGESGSVLIDLTACEYLDSSFLGCLVGLHRRFAISAVPRLQFIATADDQQRLFGPAGLGRLFHLLETRPEQLGEPVEVQLQAVDRRELGAHMLEAHRRLADLGGPDAERFRAIAQRLTDELATDA